MSLRSRAVSTIRHAHLERPARASLLLGRNVKRRLRTALNTARTALTAAKAARSDRVLSDRFAGVRATPPALETLIGSPRPGPIAVIVCLWNRRERIHDILRIIDQQTTSRGVRLVLWNNNAADSAFYRRALADVGPAGALDCVQFLDSPHNIGGIGRFIAARELERGGYTGPFIMMDDDQDFGSDFVEDLLAVSAPRSIAGVWAWNNDGAYWNRSQVLTTGQGADHVGTGGSICDSALVQDEAFFDRLPMKFLFMEDIWMSRYARRNGWAVTMVESPFTFVLSERDQGHALFDRKEGFYDWLRDPGNIPLRPEPVVGRVADDDQR